MTGEYSVVFSRKLAKKFILLYKELPCLWNRKCSGYKHRHKRHEAISKLTELVKEYDPSATRVHVMRKIESLRACARREHKRVCDSRLTARDAEDVYVPQLWYYDLISFVFGEDENTNVKPGTPELDIEEDDDIEPVEETHKFEHAEESYQEINVPTSMIEITNNIPRQYTFDGEHSNKRQSGIQDEYDAIGINVAAKLRSLPQNTRIIAEKLINDVLFQAQVNGLNSSTFISTPDPFKQDNIM